MGEDARGRPTYVRVYADEAGETHFGDVRLSTERRDSPTGTVEAVAELEVEKLAFRLVVEESSDTVPHNAPAPLLIVQLDGTVEVEVSDGERRRFGPGSILLVEDTGGKGHVTRNVSGTPRSTLIATLPA